jgi:hypothetical protein
MERTESTVVQVAPDYENTKIKEMERFGWSLHGRQEIHEKGQAYGRPSLTGETYIIKTEVNQYVKLHFIRSLSLPNLQRFRELENEYFSLNFPANPSLKGPIGLVLFAGFGLILGLANLGHSGAPSGGLIMTAALIGTPAALWLRSRLAAGRRAKQTREASALRLKEVQQELQSMA